MRECSQTLDCQQQEQRRSVQLSHNNATSHEAENNRPQVQIQATRKRKKSKKGSSYPERREWNDYHQYYVSQHQNRVGKGDRHRKDYKCTKCEYTGTKFNVERHERLKHTKDRQVSIGRPKSLEKQEELLKKGKRKREVLEILGEKIDVPGGEMPVQRLKADGDGELVMKATFADPTPARANLVKVASSALFGAHEIADVVVESHPQPVHSRAKVAVQSELPPPELYLQKSPRTAQEHALQEAYAQALNRMLDWSKRRAQEDESAYTRRIHDCIDSAEGIGSQSVSSSLHTGHAED